MIRLDFRYNNFKMNHERKDRIMAKVYTSADQLVGGTPLLELTNLEKELG